MKIAKPRFDYILLGSIPALLISVILIAFALNITLSAIKWLMLSYLVLNISIACSPIGSKKLLKSKSAGQNSVWKWLSHILLIQISVILIFTAFTQANIHLLNFTAPDTTTMSTQLANQYWQTCLLPWPWIILLGITLAYFGKKQNQPALVLNTLKPIIGSLHDKVIGFGLETFIRHALFISSILVFAIMTFFFADLAIQFLNLTRLLLSTNHVFILSMIIFILINTKFFLAFTRKLWLKHWRESRYWLLFSGLIFSLIIILNATLDSIDPFIASITLPSLQFQIFSAHDWVTQWQLIAYCWWISIIPILATRLINLSRNRTVRSFIFANLLLPAILISSGWLIEYFNPGQVIALLTEWLTALPIILICGLIALFLAATFYHNPETCDLTRMPKSGSKLSLSFFRKSWQTSAVLVLIYMTTQLGLIYILILAVTFPVILCLVLAVIGAGFVGVRN